MSAMTAGGPAYPQVSRDGIPSLLELEITQYCQLRCVHCYSNSGPQAGRGTITADDWEQVLDQAAALGVETVQFIGGEPTLDPDLPRLVRYALGAGLRVDTLRHTWLRDGSLPAYGAKVTITPDGGIHFKRGRWHTVIPAR